MPALSSFGCLLAKLPGGRPFAIGLISRMRYSMAVDAIQKEAYSFLEKPV